MNAAASEPYVLQKDHGVTDLWFPSSPHGQGRYSLKVLGSQSEERLFQMHEIEVRGTAPPMHIHDGDETLYVIDGEVSIFIGDDRIEVGAGAFVMVPKGSVHSWLVKSEQAELLFTLAPAGLEGFFTEFGTPVVAGQPRPGPVQLDPEKTAQRAKAYGVEFVGPPPMLD